MRIWRSVMLQSGVCWWLVIFKRNLRTWRADSSPCECFSINPGFLDTGSVVEWDADWKFPGCCWHLAMSEWWIQRHFLLHDAEEENRLSSEQAVQRPVVWCSEPVVTAAASTSAKVIAAFLQDATLVSVPLCDVPWIVPRWPTVLCLQNIFLVSWGRIHCCGSVWEEWKKTNALLQSSWPCAVGGLELL